MCGGESDCNISMTTDLVWAIGQKKDPAPKWGKENGSTMVGSQATYKWSHSRGVDSRAWQKGLGWQFGNCGRLISVVFLLYLVSTDRKGQGSCDPG